MNDKLQQKQLVLPALRAHMGDWIYYITFMRMSDIAERVSIAEEIHTSRSLNELIQRQLTNRASQIQNYLQTQPQRFFNSLVLAVYGGSPQWYELAIGENRFVNIEQMPDYMEGALGMLVLSGQEKIFALDGQHRVAGIKKAIRSNDTLYNEEVSAIFVGHKNDPAGLERTRRLFTTLNRYAKAVNKQEIIALDEDDIIAIITRRLVEDYPLFQDRISLAKGKNIPPTDNQSFTTIITLYDALNLFLRDRHRGWNDYKKLRPDDETINIFYQKATELWDTMTEKFLPLQELKNSDPEAKIASTYRHRNGGHLLFRPVGLMLCIEVIKLLVNFNHSLVDAVSKISQVPMEIAYEPWAGLLWDTTNKRMITAPENQKSGKKLLFYAVGGDLTQLKTNPDELKKELAGLLNKDVSSINLFTYV